MTHFIAIALAGMVAFQTARPPASATHVSNAEQLPLSRVRKDPAYSSDPIRVVASLAGETRIVSAAGITRSDVPLITLENPSPFTDNAKRRLVMVGGLGGDVDSANAVVAAVEWFKTKAPAAVRRDWSLSALPLADPDGRARTTAFRFPPERGFYEDQQQPETRYLWRWVEYQAPDLVVVVTAGEPASPVWPSVDALASAMASAGVAVEKILPSSVATALPRFIAAHNSRSRLHDGIVARVARDPLAMARMLAQRYPQAPSISCIPAVAWVNTLRVASIAGDDRLRAKVREQTRPWIAGEKQLFGEQIQLTAIAGTMIFAELAAAGGADAEAARALALDGAAHAAMEKAGGIPQYGQGWTTGRSWTSARGPERVRPNGTTSIVRR